MKQATRASRILKMLQSGRPMTSKEFLERLETSLATFKRDIDYLRREQNAPIVWSAAQRAYTLARSPVQTRGANLSLAHGLIERNCSGSSPFSKYSIKLSPDCCKTFCAHCVNEQYRS